MSEHELKLLLAEAKIALQDLMAVIESGAQADDEVGRAKRLLRRIRKRV